MKLFYPFPAQSLYMHISFNFFMFFSCTISTNKDDDDKSHQIPKYKYLSSLLAVAFVWFIEARC